MFSVERLLYVFLFVRVVQSTEFNATSLSPTTEPAGGTIGETVVTFTPAGIMSSANPITLDFSPTAGTNFNPYLGTDSGISLQTGGAGAGGTVSATVTATKITLAFSTDLPANAEYTITIPAADMGLFGTATYTGTVDLGYDTWTAVSLSMESTVAGAGSDPITFTEAGEKVKYWLPRTLLHAACDSRNQVARPA